MENLAMILAIVSIVLALYAIVIASIVMEEHREVSFWSFLRKEAIKLIILVCFASQFAYYFTSFINH